MNRSNKDLNLAIGDFLKDIKISERQQYRNMTIFPLCFTGSSKLGYITLKEASEKGFIVIKEVSEGGSVPELRVINKGTRPVLLVDGEELKGAKQNRIINTTILIKERSETIIPVSCTEQGRWSYRSNAFSESGNFLNCRIRKNKSSDVDLSLRRSGSYRSDQGKIWNMIDELANSHQVNSQTSAYSDVINEKQGDLTDYIKAFKPVEDQTGIAVFINDELIGIDLFSKSVVYLDLHIKLVKSYAMDALSLPQKNIKENERETVHDFFEKIVSTKVDEFSSPGYGIDARLRGNDLIGSALIHMEEVIHLTCFALEESYENEKMANSRSRMRIYRNRI